MTSGEGHADCCTLGRGSTHEHLKVQTCALLWTGASVYCDKSMEMTLIFIFKSLYRSKMNLFSITFVIVI